MSDIVERLRAKDVRVMSEAAYEIERLRGQNHCVVCHDIGVSAIKERDALTARVAQLEACLTDTVQQLEAGGVTE